MDEPHDVKIADAAKEAAAARITRHAVGLLRSITFAALLIIYVVWVLTIMGRTLLESNGGVSTFANVLIGLIFLVSLPALGYLCTAQDKGGNFVAPTMMVVLLFVSYGLLTGYILLWGLALASEATSVWMVAQGVGILSPILAVSLTMLLAGIARTAVVWEPAPKRLKAAKNWLYLAPSSLFLICQALHIVSRLVG